ncbi:MAG TPA: DUF1016 N-terminal domain-containing protein [Myxococcota bacterium]|nr:DUF1016 N-terminal domain-containing protein [Myxococcota bacterium]
MSADIKLTKSYVKLCTDLGSLLEKGRLRAIEAIIDVRNQTYWEIGKRLSRAREIDDKRTASKLINNLAADLKIDAANLYRALQFYHTYPDGLPDSPPARLLSWAGHQMLLPIKNKEKRDFYLRRSVESGWSVRALRRALRSNLFEGQKDGKSGRRHTLVRPESRVHNYAATLERVIDGDTLAVKIDLGFDTWRAEKIRLRGIDAPELRTEAGKQSKAFVDGRLAEVGLVVVRTYKTAAFFAAPAAFCAVPEVWGVQW